MLSALLIALREGVEAALVVGIVLVYLHRTGRGILARWVWTGVSLAVGSSAVVAVALERWRVNQEGFEGLLLLLAAVFVITMIIWMNRVARHLRRQIEHRVETYAQRTTLASGAGLAAFVFLMVLREGIELVLILRAVELSNEGVRIWTGTALGLAAAVAVGLFFFKGTLRVPLGRFFSATSVILIVVAFQLAVTGLHELSESMWLPSSKREMAIIGPIVRNDVFFFVVILGAAALLVLREWLGISRATETAKVSTPAALREWERERRSQRRWMLAAAFSFLAAVLALTADFIYVRASGAPPDAKLLEPEGRQVRIPLAGLRETRLNHYQVEIDGTSMRLLVIRKPEAWVVTLDACLICGRSSYHQDGSELICRNCAAAIYVSSIGQTGGCNPVVVASGVEGSELVFELATLAKAAGQVPR